MPKNKFVSKQVKALKLSIEELTSKRRQFCPGHIAWLRGMKTIHMNDDGITGELFAFAENGHNNYMEYTEAIQQLYDMIDILEDPGVVVTGTSGLPLFEEIVE